MNKNIKLPLITLGVTSIVLIRGMLALIDDPEGPNLLVVGVMSLALYAITLTIYLSNYSGFKKFIGRERLLLTILVQLIIVVVLFLSIR